MEEGSGDTATLPSHRRRRRGSRGGRRRRRRGEPDGSSQARGEPEAPPRASESAPADGFAPATSDGREGGSDGAPSPSADGVPGSKTGRRRRSRRGRGRRSHGDDRAQPDASREVHPDGRDDGAEDGPSDDSGTEARDAHDGGRSVSDQHRTANDQHRAADDEHRKRRRRGSRGGRRRRKERLETPVEVEAIPGEEDDLPALVDDAAAAEEQTAGRAASDGEEPRGERRRRGSRRRRKAGDEDLEPAKSPEPPRKTLILVNADDEEEQRVAVVEDGTITDFQMTVDSSKSIVNDIYRGRVVNLEPAIGAAFVDFGQGRNGFLHTSDVLSAYGEKDWSLDKLLTTTIDPEEWDAASPPSGGREAGEGGEETPPPAKERGKAASGRSRHFRARPRLPITDVLRKGQLVVAQVTKDAIGDKGPTLTTYISIPGRYLVLMPSMTRTGVSRKIDDEKERRRLKKILESLEVPPGMGVIVRTAGVGRSKADLKRDLDYLRSAWDDFGKLLRSGTGPAPLYLESDVAIRTMRDLFSPGTEAVIVDDPEVHRHIVEFTQRLMPENVDRIKLHAGPKPLFHTHSVEADFERIFARRIELPSGGSIVFDQTEALVAIDVNSGRTRTSGHDFEEIALKTNLEAAGEIARQIRLRDLGGIIVCDFIDMLRSANVRAVERAFKDALAKDRARSKVGRISQFGLLELTRQRLGPGMTKRLFHACPRCRGSGRVRNVESRAAAILRRLGSALTLKGFSKVEVRAHPEVVEYLRESCSEKLRAFEYVHQRDIELVAVADQLEDSVLRYLRADGREVRPGGRRKK